VCCSVLQNVAECCSVLQSVAVCCSVLQFVAAPVAARQQQQLAYSVYHAKYAAVCCSVLQYVAVTSGKSLTL